MSPDQPSTSVVVVAAGNSTRMGPSSVRKPFVMLAGRTVLEHACAAFDAVDAVVELVIVAHRDDVEHVRALVASSSALRKVRAVVAGGAQRTDSVRAGVAACDTRCELIAVHDAARALVSSACIERVVARAAQHGAALLATRVTDTLKRADANDAAFETVAREALWAAQTPQVFRASILRELLERASREDARATDDAALYERWVGPLPLVEGGAHNVKITTPDDLILAEALLARRASGVRA